MKRLIVNADDMGLTVGQNTAILRAHRQGIVTSTSLLANGQAFDDAVVQLQELHELSVGVHLTLLEGAPVLSPSEVPNLVDPEGRFELSYRPLLVRLAADPSMLAQIEAEWKAQILRAVDAGLVPSHMDSHKHLHIFPSLLSVAIRLAQTFGIRNVRLPLEWPPFGVGKHPRRLGPWAILSGLTCLARPRLQAAGLHTPDHFLGLLYSGQWSAPALAAAVERLSSGTTELMCHPGQSDSDTAALLQRGYSWIRDYAFDRETAALCQPDLRERLQRQGVWLVDYWTPSLIGEAEHGTSRS
jgi:hopanoid biosynthesis associated protein HpnK